MREFMRVFCLQFCHGHSLVTLFKTLPILELKDNPEVFPLLAVIQETIVTDLLEAGRQHMHQVAPDELRV